MSYSSNLPAGAEYDPRAPWNEPMNEPYEPESYVVTFSISMVLDDTCDLDEDIRFLEKDIKRLGFSIDNVEYEEL